MPSLVDHHISSFVKLLYLGDSGSGKTGSLISLVQAGYSLRILDLDNGLDSLVQFMRRDCPDKLANVQYETIRDKYKAGPTGPIMSGQPKAYTTAVKLMDKWSDDSVPAEWGDKTVFVIDSFTALGEAALAWARGLNPGAKDGRQWYGTAQESLRHILATLTSADFHANVIIITHLKYQESQAGTIKGYPTAVGSALGPDMAREFNTVLLAETAGSGSKVRRTIRTVPTALVDLKNPAPFKIDESLPLETGLSTIFTKLKELTNA